MALSTFLVEILPNESLSTAIDIRAGRIVRLGLPSGWTPAALTFQIAVEPDGTNWLNLHHAQITPGEFVAFEVVVPKVAAGSILSLPPDLGLSVGWFRLRSGTAAQPVAQEDNRQFVIVVESNI